MGALVMLLFVAGLGWLHATKTEKAWQSDYGNGIAVMAAKAAVDATLNHDLVSLQVILQDALHSPKVSFATLHDVENNLLVQAGESLSLHEQRVAASFSAPISFQQSVAGYVTVYLDSQARPKTLTLAFYVGVFLLSLIALLSLIEVWPQLFEVKPKAKTDELNDGPDELNCLEDEAFGVHDAHNNDVECESATSVVPDKAGADNGTNASPLKAQAASSDLTQSNPSNQASPSSPPDCEPDAKHEMQPAPNPQSLQPEAKPNDLQSRSRLAQKMLSRCSSVVKPVKEDVARVPDEEAHVETYVIVAAARVILQIDGFDKLRSTVSAELAEKLQARWMSKADAARKIYGGQWDTAPHHTLPNGALVAAFTSAESGADALRTACFFSQIVKNLFHEGKVSVDVRAVVALQDEFVSLTAFPNAAFSLCLSGEQHAHLAKCFNLMPIDERWFSLDSFDPAHEKLLQRQSQQLVAQ